MSGKITITVLDELRPKKPGFLPNQGVLAKYFRKKPGFWTPMRKSYIIRFVVRTEVLIKNLRSEVLTTKELPIFQKRQ
jgi:hypothetical protein